MNIFLVSPASSAVRGQFFRRTCLSSCARSDVHRPLVLTQARSRSHPTHRRFREKHAIEVIEGS